MDVLIGATKSKLQWKCPKCKWNSFVDPLDLYMASLHVSTIDCHHCKKKFHVNVTLLDPRSPTLREADGDTCPSCAGSGWIRKGSIAQTHCDKCGGSGHV